MVKTIGQQLEDARSRLEGQNLSESAVDALVSRPICHFTPMEQTFADDWPNGQVEFWECCHCGHTKEIGRNYSAC